MKSTILILVSTMLCPGAVVSVCGTGCSTTSLQTAFDSLANCGDTIQIKSTETQTGNFTITFRGCGSNPITVTSDRAATWLPFANTRVTPSQLANLAHITTPNTVPALAGALDGSSRPPAGWIFLGVAFTSTSPSGTFELIGFNPNGTATGASQIADNITFDRCYFYAPSVYTGINLQDVIRGDATNLTVKNSFFGDAFYNGYVESHGLRMLTTAGPVTATNNFITTSSIPIFVGGATPSYPVYLPNGLTSQYNYFWRPWKWNGDPAQPFAADYLTAASGTLRTGPHTISSVSSTGVITVPDVPPFIPASLLTITGVGGCTAANAANWRMTQLSGTTFQLLNFPGCNSAYTSGGVVNEFAITVCTKNLGEMKWGNGITWQNNAGENSWQPNQCQSQYNGFTDTFRTEWNSSITTPSIGAFTFTNATHLTWSGTYRIGNISTGATSSAVGDLGVCISMPATGTECHPISSFGAGTLVVSTAFSASPAGSQIGWITYTASAALSNLKVLNNVFKNTDRGFTVLACSFSNNVSCMQGHRVLNNLWSYTNSYVSGFAGLELDLAETDYAQNPSDYIFDHNTLYTPFGLAHAAFVYFGGNQCPTNCATSGQPKLSASAITNSLYGQSASGGNGPFSGDGAGSIGAAVNAYMASSTVKNNGLPRATVGPACSGGNTCSGNIISAWSDPFAGLATKGIFKLAPGSAYTRAGSDLRDVGVNFDQLPQISSLKVTAGVTAALLEFDLTAAIADASATQPCVLEVSSNRNLQSDLGSYAVVNDLNPAFFRQPDTSARANAALPAVVVSGGHVFWPIGQNATVTGDDGAGHSLALAAGTNYYGRLMCYGDSKSFTFQTGSGLSDSVQFPLSATLQVGTTAGSTGVRLQYGATPALGGTANFTLNGSGSASVALPLQNGIATYYRLQFLNGSTVTYTSPIAVYVGGV